MKAAKPDLNIEIVGINDLPHAQWNYLMTNGRTLPWLQDVEDQSVWSFWNAAWRDVFILNSQNQVVSVFNLTDHRLESSANRDALKQIFLQAATMVDTDGDGLPDDWETKYFGHLHAARGEDTDGDGIDNFSEYAFGSDPRDPKSRPATTSRFITRNSRRYFEVKFRQRAGSLLDYSVETSPDLFGWTTNPTDTLAPQPTRNLFDKTGCVEATYWLTLPQAGASSQFLRVRAAPRARQ